MMSRSASFAAFDLQRTCGCDGIHELAMPKRVIRRVHAMHCGSRDGLPSDVISRRVSWDVRVDAWFQRIPRCMQQQQQQTTTPGANLEFNQ